VGTWQVLAAAAIAAVAVAAAYLGVADDWLAADVRRALHRRVTWLVGIPAVLLVLVVGVPWVYLQTLQGSTPAPLSFADLDAVTSPTSTTTEAPASAPDDAAASGADGTSTTVPVTEAAAGPTTTTLPGVEITGAWRVGAGSQAGYSIDDTVMGQTTRVVGRTDQVTGSMQIDGLRVSAVQVVVDMRSVRCGCVHDQKYQDLLETDRFPTSTFELTTPIDLARVPLQAEVSQYQVTGRFTIHGVTRTVSFPLQAMRRGPRIAVNGKIPIRLEDYDIENPSAGPFGGIDKPVIELLVAFDRA
jgi:polyisoprenoid-binding protein YceI